MGRAKEIIVKVIPSKIANEFVKKNHYSGKVVNMSTLHFGCFLDNKLHGVMSYGPPMDKRNVLNLVDTGLNDYNKKWNEMLELNRMAFDDYLPKYSESRCIAISIRLLKKNAPQKKRIPVSVAFLRPLEWHEEAGELRCIQRPGSTHVCTPEWTDASGRLRALTDHPKQPRARRHLPATRDGRLDRKGRGPTLIAKKVELLSVMCLRSSSLAWERTATSAANDGARERSSTSS